MAATLQELLSASLLPACLSHDLEVPVRAEEVMLFFSFLKDVFGSSAWNGSTDLNTTNRLGCLIGQPLSEQQEACVSLGTETTVFLSTAFS